MKYSVKHTDREPGFQDYSLLYCDGEFVCEFEKIEPNLSYLVDVLNKTQSEISVEKIRAILIDAKQEVQDIDRMFYALEKQLIVAKANMIKELMEDLIHE